MSVFFGTVLVFGLCCLLMSAGLLLGGRKLSGGCGSKPAGTPRCASCPKRKLSETVDPQTTNPGGGPG